MEIKGHIPSQNVPTIHDAISHLIESIASEDRAISRLLNTEAEHILAFSQERLHHEEELDLTAIIKFNQSVIQFMDSVVMAEWMLMKKLDTVLLMQLKHPTFQPNGRSSETELGGAEQSEQSEVLDAEQSNELESYVGPEEWSGDEQG